MKKEYIGNCGENPFETEEEFTATIEEGEKITAKEFVTECDLHKEALEEIILYGEPSYTFWKYKYKDNDDYTYYYIWSAIEYFYQ